MPSNRYRIVPLTGEHIDSFLSQPLREADEVEWSASGKSMRRILLDLREDPRLVNQRAALDGRGRCMAMWGHWPDPDVPGVGMVWLVATQEASDKHGKALHRLLKASELADLERRYTTLCAITEAGNHLHHRWLSALGFQFHMVVAKGVFPFYIFLRNTPSV